MTQTALGELLAADLSALDLVCLLVDGVHFGEHTCVVALGIAIDAQAPAGAGLPERLGGPVERRMRAADHASSALDAEAQLLTLARARQDPSRRRRQPARR